MKFRVVFLGAPRRKLLYVYSNIATLLEAACFATYYKQHQKIMTKFVKIVICSSCFPCLDRGCVWSPTCFSCFMILDHFGTPIWRHFGYHFAYIGIICRGCFSRLFFGAFWIHFGAISGRCL